MGDATTRSLPPLPPPNTTATPRSLKRLSLSSHAPLLRELVSTPSPTPSRSIPHASTYQHSPTLSKIATDPDSITSTPFSPLATTTTSLASTPTTDSTTPEGSAKQTPRHAKRSSISYSSSPALSRSASLQRITPSSTPSTPTTDRFNTTSTPSNTQSSSLNSNSPSNSTTLEGANGSEGGGFLSSNRSMGAQPSLVELNANLLSFIAAKERKCLDLREELKRNERELTALKKKWELIVAQSVSPPSQSTRSTTTSSDSRSSPRHPPTHSANNPFDLSKPLPRQRDDMMLENENSYSAAEIEIGESVQAAKKWMGGVFGKVLEAVSGLEEEPASSNGVVEGRLVALQEEEEPEEVGSTERKRESTTSASSMEGRRTSGTSSRVSLDSEASSYVSKPAPSTTPTTSPTIRLGSSSKFPSHAHHFSAVSTSDLTSSSSTSSFGQYQSRSSEDENSPLQSRMEAEFGAPRVKPIESNGHNRRRSTFDMLGSAAGGGWNSIGKRWAGLTDSETFQNSKRATMNLVDSIEKGIVTTLGPLDPPSTTPTSSPRLSSEIPLSPPPTSATNQSLPPTTSATSNILNWGRVSVSGTSKPKEEPEKTPKQGEANWDWSSFLERPTSVTPVDLDELPTEQRLGGYRRPSLTHTLVSSSGTIPLYPTSPNSRTRNKALPISPSSRSSSLASPSSRSSNEIDRSTASGSTPKSLTTRKGISPNSSLDMREKENGTKGVETVKEEDGWGW